MAQNREEKEASAGYVRREGRRGELLKPEPSDQALIAGAQRGDTNATALFYARYRVRVLNYLCRFTGDRMTAEDLTQETFLRAVRRLPSYRPTGSAAGWIYRIAKNLALNHVRDQKRNNREVSLDEPVICGEGEAMDRSEAIPGSRASPDEEASRMETGEAVQQALLKVAAPYREALILCDIQERSYREAADVMRCSVNTVASRLARGRAQMACLLGYLEKETAA